MLASSIVVVGTVAAFLLLSSQTQNTPKDVVFYGDEAHSETQRAFM